MKEITLRKIITNAGNEGNHMENLNDRGTFIAKAQLGWLCLLANKVVENLKVPNTIRAEPIGPLQGDRRSHRTRR